MKALHFWLWWSDDYILCAIIWKSSREIEILFLQYALPQTIQNSAYHNLIPNYFLFKNAVAKRFYRKLKTSDVSINSFAWILAGTLKNMAFVTKLAITKWKSYPLSQIVSKISELLDLLSAIILPVSVWCYLLLLC